MSTSWNAMPLARVAEAERQAPADEVDVVAAAGELLAELGGDGARAAHGRVAGDADSHRRTAW